MSSIRLALLLAAGGLFCAEARAIQVDPPKLFFGMSPRQRKLYKEYVHRRMKLAIDAERGDDFYFWAFQTQLPRGDALTFVAITQALEATRLPAGGNGLEQVDGITSITGERPGESGAAQFNIGLRWKPLADLAFRAALFTPRMGLGHDGEYGLSYLSSSAGLHLLFGSDGSTSGHAHVDYRYVSAGDLLNWGEGHFQTYGADISKVGPETSWGIPIDSYARHRSWFGPIAGVN